MNNLQLIRYFALLTVFCAEYRYVSNETWPQRVQRFINEACTVEPREKMKVNIQNLSFEWHGKVVKSYAHESLTLIVNEHLVQGKGEGSDENSSETRVYLQFIISLTNSDSMDELIFTFWSMQIKSFVYFVSTGSKMKLTLMPQFHKGIIALDFLNPGDSQLFWKYASTSRNRSRQHVIDVLRFEIFNRVTREKVEDSSFAVIHTEWSEKASTTYNISVERDGVTRTPLMIFSAGRFSVSRIVEDRIGVLASDEPNKVFVLQFSPFENDAAVAFQREMFAQRSHYLKPISLNELKAFID